MGSIGKTVRGTVSALALGFSAVAAVAVVAAPAAVAQQHKASQKFVEAYQAGGAALKAKDYATALSKADAAAGEAADKEQKLAVENLRLGVYTAKNDQVNMAKTIENIIQMDPSKAGSYRETLIGIYSVKDPAKAEEMIKASPNNSSVHLGWLADRSLKGKKCDEAIKYGQQAIDQAKKEGKKPSDTYYNIKLNCYQQTKNLDGYYKTLEEAAPMFPSKADLYFKPLIDKALKDKFNRTTGSLDLYRAYTASKVSVKPEEKADFAESAFSRKMPVEAEAIIEPLIKDGTIGGPKDNKAERNKRVYASIQTDSKAMRGGSLAAAETAAAAAPTGAQYAEVGEQYFGLGDYKKAADLIKKGLDKGGLKPEEEAFAKLHLGIAQFKGGQKDAARTTWSGIKSDAGAESLAHAWTAISKV